MDTLSRQLKVPVLFWLPFLKESTLKGNNLLLQEQFFSFESRPYYRGAAACREENRRTHNLSSFLKMTLKPATVVAILGPAEFILFSIS